MFKKTIIVFLESHTKVMEYEMSKYLQQHKAAVLCKYYGRRVGFLLPVSALAFAEGASEAAEASATSEKAISTEF